MKQPENQRKLHTKHTSCNLLSDRTEKRFSPAIAYMIHQKFSFFSFNLFTCLMPFKQVYLITKHLNNKEKAGTQSKNCHWRKRKWRDASSMKMRGGGHREGRNNREERLLLTTKSHSRLMIIVIQFWVQVTLLTRERDKNKGGYESQKRLCVCLCTTSNWTMEKKVRKDKTSKSTTQWHEQSTVVVVKWWRKRTHDLSHESSIKLPTMLTIDSLSFFSLIQSRN